MGIEKLGKKTVYGIMLVLCLIISFVFVNFYLNSSLVSAEPETTIYIDPTPVTAYVCKNFTVALNIKDVTDLYQWQVKLSWNPSLLECLGATEGPFLMSSGRPTTFPSPIIDNTAGTIIMACSLMVPPGVSGNGTLAYIEFHCKGAGECDLIFVYPGTFLLNSNLFDIPHVAVNGHVIQTESLTSYLHKEEPLVPLQIHKEEPLQPVHLHPIGPFNPSDPIGSEWHELYPQYCNHYILTSWVDTDLSRNLTASDQIDFTNMETGERIWYHLDRVTWTIFITDVKVPPPQPQLYAELEYLPKETPPPIGDPVCTDWHVVYPPESYCRRFHVWSWYDNGDGVLSYCDEIDVEYRDEPGLIYYYHVEEVVMDLILTKKCFYEPISTEWHELYPTFSQYYHINSWEDANEDGKLSTSDQIDLHLDWPKFHHDNPLIGYSASTAPNTNATLWTYNTTAPVYSSPAIVDNVVYIGSTNGVMYALNAQTGAVIWTYPTDGPIMSSPAVFYGKVYFLSCDGNMYALDAATGTLLWSLFIDPGPWPWSSPAVHSGRVFIAASTGDVLCLNAFNGAVIWRTHIGGQPDGPIAVANNKVFSGMHNFDASNPTLVALNELTGVIIWTYNYTAWHPGLVGMVNSNGVAVTDGDGDGDLEVYFGIVIWPDGAQGNTAICLDEATGNEIWTQNINGWSTSTPAVHNGKVFIGSDDFRLYALDAATGAYIWTYTTKDQIWSAPAVADGKVFVASLDHALYALDENFGGLIWSYNTSASRIYGSPAVACGKVFIGSENGKVYAFGPEENKVRWYHVDRVTLTILLKEMYVEPPMQLIQLYAEFTGSFEMFYEPVMNPVCTIWHVVYPLSHYSELFHIIGWEDNGDGVLSFCDYIEVKYLDTGEIRWYHVEELACDIILTKKCFYEPIGSQWHELFPEFCSRYNIASWNDTNSDSKLSSSDQIGLVPGFSAEQWDEFWSLGDVNRDGYINQTDINLITAAYGSQPGNRAFDLRCDINKDLKVDNIDLNICTSNQGKNIWTHFGVVNREVWYHVDNMTLTIKLTESAEPPVLLYAEFMAPFSEYFTPIINPLSTRWHVIYPLESFCREFHITSWEDNGDGVLSFCDIIDVEYLDEPGVIHWYHVEEIACDIKISRTADIATLDVKRHKTVVGQGYNCRINVTVKNEGSFPETFNLTLYANTSVIETKEIILESGASTTITFTWNTTCFAKGNYTIWAYAWPVPGETDTADNTFVNGWVVVAMVGDIAGIGTFPNTLPDGKIDMKDVAVVSKQFGIHHPDPRYIPNYDINGDGKNDMKDIAIVSKQFGKHDP